MAPPRTGILIELRRFRYAIAAVSAVEFAILLPLMLTLYLGGTEVTQAITLKRKLTVATRSVGDLVAQGVTINNSEMSRILGATSAVMAPYPTSYLKVVVSSVVIDDNGNATVAWSDGYQTAARPQGSSVVLPIGLNVPDTTLIWAEASFDYTPPIGYMVTGTITLNDRLYLRPRNVNCITRTGQYNCS